MSEYIEVTRESDFLIEVSNTEIIITGTDFKFPFKNSVAISNKHITIRANELILTDDIILYEKNLTLMCNALKASKPIRIDVSGITPEDKSIPADSGTTPGASGKDGINGDNGGNAGSITILIYKFEGIGIQLIANGGNGSKGQDGGNGVEGYPGSDAPPRTGYLPYGDNRGLTGGAGGDGGNAGRGGNGGNAGQGGKIVFKTIIPFNHDIISAEAKNGKPGKPGLNGKPGIGGLGGAGGVGFNCYEDPIPRPH